MNSSRYRKGLLAAFLLLVPTLATACSGNAGTTAAAASPSSTVAAPPASPSSGVAVAPRPQSDQRFRDLEQRFHARLGVYALDTGTGRTVAYRADERFAYCSTYKVMITGMLLQHDTDAQLDQVVHYRASDLLAWAPVTSRHVSSGMTVRDLMTAAIEYSDNTAANLLLARLGGPTILGGDLRRIGDSTTRPVRTEPSVNTAIPGDPRDTTTPRASGIDLRDFVLGNLLPASRRGLLTSWLRANTTGGPYVRAGVPRGWTVADKTGNGGWGTRNDIAVAWPADGGPPVVISVLSDRESASATSDDALIADATKDALTALSAPTPPSR